MARPVWAKSVCTCYSNALYIYIPRYKSTSTFNRDQKLDAFASISITFYACEPIANALEAKQETIFTKKSIVRKRSFECTFI